MFKYVASALAATILCTQAAAAAPFSADSAAASSEFSGHYLAINTINGSGLS